MHENAKIRIYHGAVITRIYSVGVRAHFLAFWGSQIWRRPCPCRCSPHFLATFLKRLLRDMKVSPGHDNVLKKLHMQKSHEKSTFLLFLGFRVESARFDFYLKNRVWGPQIPNFLRCASLRRGAPPPCTPRSGTPSRTYPPVGSDGPWPTRAY